MVLKGKPTIAQKRTVHILKVCVPFLKEIVSFCKFGYVLSDFVRCFEDLDFVWDGTRSFCREIENDGDLLPFIMI